MRKKARAWWSSFAKFNVMSRWWSRFVGLRCWLLRRPRVENSPRQPSR
jgi:hypothetical protein